MIKIIKQTSGNILIQGIDKDTRYHYLNANKEVWVNGDEIQLKERGLITYSFKFEDVASTQVPPAAEVVPTDIRNLADTLSNDFFFELSGSGSSDSVVTKALVFDSYVEKTLTATTHNLSVDGLNDSVTLYLTATVGLTLSGIVAPSPVKRQILQIINVGTTNIVFPRENVNSSAENRFIMPNATVTLSPEQTYILMYDVLVSRWRISQLV